MSKGNSILIIEDDALISDIVKKSLGLEGYRVETARTGEEGLKKIEELNPDLVLLDILLPKIDGWEVLTRIRSDPKFAETPVVVISALTDERSKVQALRGGADDYITKPFSSLELVARIEAVLKRSRKPSKEGVAIDSKIPARKGEKIVLLNIEEITYAYSRGEYAYVNTENDRFLTNFSLSKLEKMLENRLFFRAHRSFLVNLNKVKEIIRSGPGLFELVLDDEFRTRVPVSRRQSSILRKMLNI